MMICPEPRDEKHGVPVSSSIRSSHRVSLLLSVSLLISGCGSGPAGEASDAPKEHVHTYLEQALTFIEENSYQVTRNPDSWIQIRESALEKGADAQRVEETYSVITDALLQSSGDHSFLLTPENLAEEAGKRESPTVTAVGDGVASLTLPAFNETAGGLVTEYMDTALKGIAANSDEASCGWIVDLRGNSGGNMLPMLVSIAPFVPDGHVMTFLDGSGTESMVTVVDTSVLLEGERVLRSTSTTPELSGKPLAVLQSSDTASSAEATLISLQSREDVRSFGSPSAGYATGNVSLRLPDGAVLAVTQSQMLSADGALHPGPIPPDVATDDPQQDAVEWLSGQCSG